MLLVHKLLVLLIFSWVPTSPWVRSRPRIYFHREVFFCLIYHDIVLIGCWWRAGMFQMKENWTRYWKKTYRPALCDAVTWQTTINKRLTENIRQLGKVRVHGASLVEPCSDRSISICKDLKWEYMHCSSVYKSMTMIISEDKWHEQKVLSLFCLNEVKKQTWKMLKDHTHTHIYTQAHKHSVQCEPDRHAVLSQICSETCRTFSQAFT